jgi:hypothetical protein
MRVTRHAWRVWRNSKILEVADRILRYAAIAGRENVVRRHGFRPGRSGPRRSDAGRRAVRKLRGSADPSRAFGGIKGATARLWKFESISLQR